MKKFNYEKFVKDIHSTYSEKLSLAEIQAILDLEEGYSSQDTPVSTGKKLVITGVFFKGKKTNDIEIDFSQKITTGINIWVADNLSGKSSLFKIIQFYLKGN